MPRVIPSQLVSHLKGDATTTCMLLRVIPLMADYPEYGVTTLDQSVVYDDGDGEMIYSAAVGFEPSAVQFRSDIAVDNAEARSLMPVYDIPVSEADIAAGAYDFAQFRLYQVNYENLAAGHVLLQAGTLGRITTRDDGLSFVNELRGKSAQLKQSVCEKDSLTCRATFGSQPAGSDISGPIERFPCGYPAETLLVDGTVEAVGIESTRTFKVRGWTDAAGALVPGMTFWEVGANAGRSFEIESSTADGWITLAFETPYPIAEDDHVKFRPDCSKMARDEVKGCVFWFGLEWGLHFRGEPDIPIGDAGSMEVPGASTANWGGGSISPEPDETIQ